MTAVDPYAPPASSIEEEVSHIGSIRRFEEAIVDHMKGSRVWLVMGMALAVISSLAAVVGAGAVILSGAGFNISVSPNGAGVAALCLAVAGALGWSFISLRRYWRAISRLSRTAAREDLQAALRARIWGRLAVGVLFTGIGLTAMVLLGDS